MLTGSSPLIEMQLETRLLILKSLSLKSLSLVIFTHQIEITATLVACLSQFLQLL